jgi:protein ImuB
LRARPVDGPFALILHQQNTDRIYSLNQQAQDHGLCRGMGYSDARAFCRDLQSRPADLNADARFLQALLRWAKRYCPWVGAEGIDGLVMDISGSAHLFGGEAAMLDDMRLRLGRAGMQVRIGVADTRGAAWALAHYCEGIAPAGETPARISPLPVAALRLPDKTCVALQRVGLRHISDLIALPRGAITRRFGADVLLRLDQALGAQPEEISPVPDAPHYGVRLTLPDPIGLTADVMAGTERLLVPLCARMKAQQIGARVLQLTLRRVDQASQQVELRLARALHDPDRILPLFERGIAGIDAGYGIDRIRLEATRVEPLLPRQITRTEPAAHNDLDDLLTRIGNRIGLENVQRFLPADSHIPERGYIIAPAAYSEPAGPWVALRPRPLRLFPPEPVAGHGPHPPARFRWRRMLFSTGRVTGPERIAPEWWLADENWRAGTRDYWQVETRQGLRLWLFYTPQNPNWFVQGEFA